MKSIYVLVSDSIPFIACEARKDAIKMSENLFGKGLSQFKKHAFEIPLCEETKYINLSDVSHLIDVVMNTTIRTQRIIEKDITETIDREE